MTDRIGALGGILTIAATPGSGTKIVATVPLNDSRVGGWSPSCGVRAVANGAKSDASSSARN
jgi:hypothetical protein